MEKRIWVYAAIDIALGLAPIIFLALIMPDLTLIYYGSMIGRDAGGRIFLHGPLPFWPGAKERLPLLDRPGA